MFKTLLSKKHVAKGIVALVGASVILSGCGNSTKEAGSEKNKPEATSTTSTEATSDSQDTKQITKSVGYGDTVKLFEKKHGDKQYFDYSAADGEKYINAMGIAVYQWRYKDPSINFKFNTKEANDFIEEYLPSDAKLTEISESDYIEESSDVKSGEYHDMFKTNLMYYTSKESAKRFNNNGEIVVEVRINNLDEKQITHPEPVYIHAIKIYTRTKIEM